MTTTWDDVPHRRERWTRAPHRPVEPSPPADTPTTPLRASEVWSEATLRLVADLHTERLGAILARTARVAWPVRRRRHHYHHHGGALVGLTVACILAYGYLLLAAWAMMVWTVVIGALTTWWSVIGAALCLSAGIDLGQWARHRWHRRPGAA